MNAKQAVKRYYEQVDKFSGGYFWSGFGNTSNRKQLMDKTNFDFSGKLAGRKLEIHFSINPSRNNLYKKQSITLDGKRIQRRTIEKLLASEK